MNKETKEKIENGAKAIATYLNCNEAELVNCITKLFDQLLAEKRKEVEIGEEQNLGQDEAWCYWYKCPSCGDTMITNNQKFCGECGSQLKWTE